MPVEFRTHRLAAARDALIIEQAFATYAAFAGILDTQFDNLIEVSSVTAVTGAGWHTTWRTEVLPASLLLRYHKTAVKQGASVGDSSGIYWTVVTDASGYPEIYKNGVLVHHLPVTTPATADCVLAFRQIQQSDDPADIWVTLSLWMNDQWVTSYTERSGVTIPSPSVGMASNAVATIYTNVSVPELCDYAEYGTLDPGEAAAGGLQRAIDGRYLRYFLRADGAIRAWKVKPVASVLTLTDSYREVPTTDLRNLANRVRMVGAYFWGVAYDGDLIQQYGDRYQETNNPMLFSDQECYDEAVKTIKRATEATFTGEITTPYTPFVEPEDRIVTPTGDWLVSEQDLELTSGLILQQFGLRKYVWGEP